MNDLSSLIERVEKGARLSDDGVYRYLLWRRWDLTLPRAVFIMLNPSTADADIDDPTIRRCIGFAKAWGMGGIRVVNLYPFRATKPDDLWKAPFPRGQGNLREIENAADPQGINIAAWGGHGKEVQVREVRGLFYDLGIPLYALKVNADGSPAHPLYIKGDTMPVCFEPARTEIAKGEPFALPRALQSSHPATASGIVERESGDAQ